MEDMVLKYYSDSGAVARENNFPGGASTAKGCRNLLVTHATYRRAV